MFAFLHIWRDWIESNRLIDVKWLWGNIFDPTNGLKLHYYIIKDPIRVNLQSITRRGNFFQYVINICPNDPILKDSAKFNPYYDLYLPLHASLYSRPDFIWINAVLKV